MILIGAEKLRFNGAPLAVRLLQPRVGHHCFHSARRRAVFVMDDALIRKVRAQEAQCVLAGDAK